MPRRSALRKTKFQNRTETSQYARGLIEASLDPLIAISPRNKITDANEATVKITGVPRAKIIGTDFSRYFTEPAKARVGYRRALEKGSVSNYPLTVQHVKSKKLTDVLYNAKVQKDKQGNVLAVFAAVTDITERKKAEFESARIAQELTNLIDTANAPIFGIDKDGKVTEWNRTAVSITGYEKRETLGRNLVEEFITEEYKIPVKEVLDKALKGTETANYEFPLYTKKRDRRDVLLNATTRRDVQGNIIGVIGVGQDITERKKAEVESARIAQELINLIDTANAPIFGIDKDGKVTEWNRTAVSITGYEKRETFGRNLVEEFITEEYKIPVKEVLDKALKGTETANFELPLYTKKRDRRDVLLNATTRRDVQGNIIGVIGVGQDITERKKAEVESARIAQELINLIDAANAPIFGIDKDGRVTEWNRTAVSITGYEKSETLGKNLVEEFITEEYKIPVKEVLDKALRGTETANFELPVYTKRRDRRDVLLNATTRRDVQGNIIGVIGVGQDITERKQLEKKLEEYAKGLETKVVELERFQRLTVGRELKMIELKQELEELRKIEKMVELQPVG